jgi:hypothetical protein
MPELAARLLAEHGLQAHPASLSRLLIQHGFTVRASCQKLESVWDSHSLSFVIHAPWR